MKISILDKDQRARQKVKHLLAFGVVCLVFGFGCKKFVEIPPPQTELVTTNVFNNNASANSAQTNIYTLMFTNSESFYMAYEMGDYSDELQSYVPIASDAYYYNSLVVPNTYGPWSNAYGYIYDANAVITGLQTISGCSPAVKQQLTGEALFIRAFWHLYLTSIYGDVPIVLTTSYTTNGTIARSPRVQVLQQVAADLKNAQSLLNSNYVDGSDTVTTTLRVRPNKAVATALLARTYLYLGDYSASGSAAYYAKADSAASVVIGNGAYSLAPLNGVFLIGSPEAIWQLQTPSGQGWDTADGEFFILLSAPNSGNLIGSQTISTQLIGAFEPGDQRETNWIGSFVTPGATYYFPYKYKNNTLENTEYETVLRLGELYLIRSEAEAHEGKTSNAVADLNVIRIRAGLPNYTGTQDQASLLAAILHERQVELFTEWGARWFDLERTGNAASVMGAPSNVCQAKGGIWASDNHQLLFPIPQSDRNTDYNLTQNPGY